MKTQKKKKKITKPFAIKCPVCNGRGEVKAHLYKDDSFDIDMTYVTCRACKGHGYIIHYGAEFTESQPNITTKVKKKNRKYLFGQQLRHIFVIAIIVFMLLLL